MKINPKDAAKRAAWTARTRASEIGGRAVDAASKTGIGGRAIDAASKAGKIGGRAADAASKAMVKAGKALDSGKKSAMLSRYNPVFPDEYDSADYNRPKMIVIADKDQRKGIEVCEGAIGWHSKEAGLDVLHLYEEAVPTSGVAFFPRPVCDSVYYEDSMTPGRFVSLDCYFDVLNKDKITELRRIAYELGAKKCVLEATEEAKSVRVGKGGAHARQNSDVGAGKVMASIGAVGGKADADFKRFRTMEQRIVFEQEFEGNANPRRPELKWFAHDQEIEFLIETRCNGDESNQTKKYKVHLDSSSAQTMSIALASKIDKALGKMGAFFNFSLAGEAQDEMRKSLTFEVEF